LSLFLSLTLLFSFFLTHPPPPVLYTLSLHDALPISSRPRPAAAPSRRPKNAGIRLRESGAGAWKSFHYLMSFHTSAAAVNLRRLDRKSTRLNSSHVKISYAVFCLKKKKKKKQKKSYN